ncbi:MAG: hypothetical protein AAGG09_14155 [Pseudomonadota bacterium]
MLLILLAVFFALPAPGMAMGSAPDRILFVGRAFDMSPGIMRHVGNLAAASYRFDTPAVGVPFYAETPPDLDRVEGALASFRPVVVVISAFEEPHGWLGQDRALRDNLTRVANTAVSSGARVLLLAHPPTKPGRPVGFGAKIRRIEAVTADVARDTGATLVRTGAFFGAIPVQDRMSLYHERGYAFSRQGQRAIALTIAMGLGLDVRSLTYQGADEPPLPAWIDLAEDWAVATGLRPPPLVPRP